VKAVYILSYWSIKLITTKLIDYENDNYKNVITSLPVVVKQQENEHFTLRILNRYDYVIN